MQRIYRIKRTFIRQTTDENCGLACLAMILAFVGRNEEAANLREIPVDSAGISMLSLKKLAATFNLPARCVELDIPFLRKITKPCVLHTVNEFGRNHFIVCYRAIRHGNKYKYLVADPGLQVNWLSEALLEQQWKSRAAIYFDDLSENLSGYKKPTYKALISTKAYPVGLLAVIPTLSLFIASSSIGLTWILQKGITDSRVLNGNVILILLILLFVISIFKNLFTFLRQYILINISISVNDQLVGLFLRLLTAKSSAIAHNLEKVVKTGLVNVQKMQNSISTLIGVMLSDGSLVIALLAAMAYLSLTAAIIQGIYLLLLSAIVFFTLPELSYQKERVTGLSSATESLLLIHVNKLNATPSLKANDLPFDIHRRSLSAARNLAVRFSKQYLLFECIGTTTVIILFIYGLQQMRKGAFGYSSFMLLVIEAYIISTLFPKICAAVHQVAEGFDAAIQFGGW